MTPRKAMHARRASIMQVVRVRAAQRLLDGRLWYGIASFASVSNMRVNRVSAG
jgi:hypothetical protein